MSEPLCSPLVKTSTDDTATDPVINHLKSAGRGQPPKMYTESQLSAARAEGRREGLIMACASRSEGRWEGIEWVGKQFCANVSQEWVADQLRALADKGETNTKDES